MLEDVFGTRRSPVQLSASSVKRTHLSGVEKGLSVF